MMWLMQRIKRNECLKALDHVGGYSWDRKVHPSMHNPMAERDQSIGKASFHPVEQKWQSGFQSDSVLE